MGLADKIEAGSEHLINSGLDRVGTKTVSHAGMNGLTSIALGGVNAAPGVIIGYLYKMK